MSQNSQQNYQIDTIAVQTGLNSDTNHSSVVAPVYMASNFRFSEHETKPAFDYSRGGNPTRDLLANALTELEGGAGAVVTSSGMAAINLVLQLLTSQDTLVAPKDCYGGSHRLFESLAKRGNFKLVWLDFYADDFEKALIAEKPTFIWVESPSNPLLRVTDIEKINSVKSVLNAKVVVDNTFLSPVGLNPIELGADFVVHSSTKYLNGHSDVVSGAVVAADSEDAEQLAWWANNTGVTGSPFDSYLILRGIRTLSLRVKQHTQNAQAVAEVLEAHELVRKVNYTGLPSHPDHQLANRQHKVHGGMVSFELDTDKADLKAFLGALKLFTLAESLGGTESLICYPSTMTHAAMSEEAQREAGIRPGLLRVSVGIEDKSDLIADLFQALNVALVAKNDQDGGSNVASISELDESATEVEPSATCRLSPALAALW